ncbi:MAG: acyltransferase family protein [Candidatus Hodarchaeota archaeon]
MNINQPINSERRNDLDWLRIFAILIIFFFHSARAFDGIPWEIKNGETHIGFTIFIIFTASWIMPLFFLLSGMSSYYALGKKTQTEFIKERSKRLMIPYIFGISTVLSIQVYYEALFGNEYLPPFNGNFLEFYLFHYFTRGFYYMGGFFPITGIYLWYLLFLFIFTFFCLKFFLYLRKENMVEKLLKLANFSAKKGGILIFVIPMIILEIIGIIFLPFIQQAGWSVLVYLCIFIYGYIFASNDQFKKALERNSLLTFIIGIISSIIGILLYLNLSTNILLMILLVIFLPLSGLCWLVTILGFASKFLNKNSKRLQLLNELVLPFYILHQAIIIMVDYYIIQLNVSVFLKYLIVLPIAFGLTLALVLIIRKIDILRLLFGMKLKKKSSKF